MHNCDINNYANFEGIAKMKITNAYNSLMKAADLSFDAEDTKQLNAAIHAAGMTSCKAEDERFVDYDMAHELRDGDERLFVQYRSYDTSRTFSIRPDMNVYLIRHTIGSQVVNEKQIKFLDQF